MRHLQNFGHGAKVAQGVVFGVQMQMRANGEHALDGEQHAVAIGRRSSGSFGTDHAAGTGAVVDHHGLTQRLSEALGEQARHHIGRGAGAVRQDHFDGPVRIIARLRPGSGRGAGQRSHACASESETGDNRDEAPAIHVLFSG